MNFLEGNLIKNGDNYHFIEQKQSNCIGIRPYDLKLGDSGNLVFNGMISLVEPLGHSSLVSVKIGDALVRLFAEPNYTAERGTSIICSADIEYIAVFDKSSGQSLNRDACVKDE